MERRNDQGTFGGQRNNGNEPEYGRGTKPVKRDQFTDNSTTKPQNNPNLDPKRPRR